MIPFPTVRVGQPIRHEALTIFPLFIEPNGQVDYLLSDEAIQSSSVTVEEVSESGSVPDLLVENKGDLRVLFIEGEELIGAKQNRILNTSVLIAAHSKVKIPVSCVEQGRWGYKTKHFGSSRTHSPSKLRHALKASVSQSLKTGHGYRSDQGKVWGEVDKLEASFGVTSKTSAMADSFEAQKEPMEAFASKLPYPEGASGLAVAIGGKVTAVDVFDKPATCQKVWNRLLTGFIMDALVASEESGHLEPAAVEGMLAGLRNSSWQKAQPVGEGEEFRLGSTDGTQASVLTFGGSVVHGSVLVG